MSKVIRGELANEVIGLLKNVKKGTYELTTDEVAYIENIRCLELVDIEFDDTIDASYLKGLEILVLANVDTYNMSVLSQLPNLRKLKLENVPIKSLEEIKELVNLQELHLTDMLLDSIKGIEFLKNLQVLSLAFTNVRNFKDMDVVSNLQTIRVGSSGVVSLDGISKFTNLRNMSLSGMRGDDIGEVGVITTLEVLDLTDTRTKSLAEIEKLVNLQELYLDNTLITDLTGIDKFKDLRKLSLGGLKIANLKGVEKLEKLERVDLDHLQLKNIPKEVALLPKIYELEAPYCVDVGDWNEDGIIVYGSTLSTQPISLFEQPKELVRAYYEAPKVPINESKVVFLGNGGAGKTYTIKRILNNGKKKAYQTDTTPGIEISPYHVDYNGIRFDINFWDFGGQEIMHSMHRCFLTGRTCYVIVIYNRNESLDRQARYWLRNIESFAKGCPVILAVNCFDDSFTEGVDTQKLRADFPNLGDIITYSAKCSNDQEFQRLTEAIIKQAQKMDSCGLEFPENWANIRAGLLSQAAEGVPYIDNQQYYALCDKYGEENSQIRKWLLEWFNDLGICFSYHQENGGKELQDYKVLSPKWLTNAIYIIINNGKGRSKQGVMLKQTIIDILNMESTGVDTSIHYKEYEVDYVLAVMRKFRLSYELPNEEGESEEEFIPALCSYIEPEEVYPEEEEYEKHIIYQMRYQYLPDNVIHQLMISCYSNLNTNKIWRQGMRIDEKIHGQAAIVSVRDDKILQIDIYSNGEYPTWTMVQHLRNQISQINYRLNINADDYIVKQKNKQVASFPVTSVLKAKQKGRMEMDSTDGGEFESYLISDILDDSFGNENVEKYMECVQVFDESISVDRLAESTRQTNIYYNCQFGDTNGFSAEIVLKVIQKMRELEETLTEEILDTFVAILNNGSHSLEVHGITNEVKKEKTIKGKLDCLQKLTAIGANAIKIGEAINNIWPALEQKVPELWLNIEPVVRNYLTQK